MGYALALEASKRGANVTLISGETYLHPPIGIKKFIKVRSAEDFYNSIVNIYEDYDIIIMAAAIADYTPESRSRNKIKKNRNDLTLELKRTNDVLKYLGEHKKDGQVLVGFAAETENIIKNAEKKLKNKNLDYIIANDVSSTESGFQSDHNSAVIVSNDSRVKIGLCAKHDMAREIFNFVI
jgi:phosphopantothenoylcysteine decarboxylase/phosphopantothenate--cysteine ligase